MNELTFSSGTFTIDYCSGDTEQVLAHNVELHGGFLVFALTSRKTLVIPCTAIRRVIKE